MATRVLFPSFYGFSHHFSILFEVLAISQMLFEKIQKIQFFLSNSGKTNAHGLTIGHILHMDTIYHMKPLPPLHH